MGSFTEINTLVRFPTDFDFSSLKQGQTIDLTLERERVLPLRIAVLYFHGDWNFLGYCRVLELSQADGKTKLKVEILSVFNDQEQKMYKAKFVEAGKLTGEAK